MFFHLYKYRIITLLKSKEPIFWTFAFPIILGTLFYVSFGSLMNEFEFEPIPVAVVAKDDSRKEMLKDVLNNMDKGNGNSFLSVRWTDENEALTLMQEEEIDGIIYADSDFSLTVSKEGLNESILRTFLNHYLQYEDAFMTIGRKHPEKMAELTEQLSLDTAYVREGTLTGHSISWLAQYFYALIAMCCLYACFLGLSSIMSIQKNLSSLAARRTTAPVSKVIVILADFLATITIQTCSVLLLLFYLLVILKLNLGHQIGFIILTSVLGSVIGISFGFFVGSLGNWKESTKNGIVSGITMLFCFCSGLMYSKMKFIVEQHIPLFNKINPAAVITDSLYSLNVYETYDRFIMNTIILVTMIGLLIIVSCISITLNDKK